MFQKSSDNNNWNDLNEQTGYIITNKSWWNFFRVIKILLSIILSLAVLAGGGFAFSNLITDIFNFEKFHHITLNPNDFIGDLNDLSLVVDMNKAPIKVSNRSLRLTYLETSLEKNLVQFAEKFWWGRFLVNNESNQITFQWLKHDNQNPLTVEDINHDGLFQAKLKLALTINPKLGIVFDMGGFIVNTGKFVENFMIFNRFESQTKYSIFQPVSKHERGNRGYLGTVFNIGNTETSNQKIDNKLVYQIVQQKLDYFINNEKQEFGTNFHIYPILTSLTALPDCDFFNISSAASAYLSLINNQTTEIFDYDNSNQLQIGETFKIIYGPSRKQLENFLIFVAQGKFNNLVDFLKDIANLINFLPFVNTSVIFDNNQQWIHSSASRTVTSGMEWSNITNYFYEANLHDDGICYNLNSSIINLSKSKIVDLDQAKRFINQLLVNKLFNIYQHSEQFLKINNPEAGRYQANFEHWNIYDNFQSYFSERLSYQTKLYQVNLYNSHNQIVNYSDNSSFKPDEIKHAELLIGDEINQLNNDEYPLSFFVKVHWSD